MSQRDTARHPTPRPLSIQFRSGNFDGYDWAIGDRLIFEEGTESRIKQEPGKQFYVWDDPTPADFEEVKRAIGVPHANDWGELFRTAEVNELENDLRRTIRGLPKIIGCLAVLCAVVLLALSSVMRISPWLLSVVMGVIVLIMAAYAGDIRYYRAKIRAAEERGIGEADNPTLHWTGPAERSS